MPAPCAATRAATPGWSLPSGSATKGIPLAYDSRTVFRPGRVITAAARFTGSSCGAYRTTMGLPASVPSQDGSRPPPNGRYSYPRSPPRWPEKSLLKRSAKFPVMHKSAVFHRVAP